MKGKQGYTRGYQLKGKFKMIINQYDKVKSKEIEEEDKYFFYKCSLSSKILNSGFVEFEIRYSDNELLFREYYLIQGKERRIDIVRYRIYKAFEKDLDLQSILEREKNIFIRYFDNANRLTVFEVVYQKK